MKFKVGDILRHKEANNQLLEILGYSKRKYRLLDIENNSVEFDSIEFIDSYWCLVETPAEKLIKKWMK